MKHLKPYKIFESNVSDESNSEIMEVLSHVADYGYDIKIYDFYYYGRPKDDINTETHVLSMKFSSIQKISKRAKLVKISNKDNPSKWFSIDDYKKIGFSSSAFHFSGDFVKYREFFLELLDSVSQFSDRNPKLSVVDTDNVLILLEYGVISEEDMEKKETINELYKKLNIVLKNSQYAGGDSKTGRKKQYDISYYPSEMSFRIKPIGDDGSTYSYKIIATLCRQLRNTVGYGWMDRRDYEPIDNQDFNTIMDLLKHENCEITFTTETVSGQFQDDIKFEILPISNKQA